MPSQKEIVTVIKILDSHRHEFVTPALTEIAERLKDPFKVLISCILSLRTRDTTTARVSERLFASADNPRAMSKMTAREIAKIIRHVNYYKTKALRIRQISIDLNEKYGGKVPDNIDELLKFRGVGRKTANIVVVYGFRKEGLPIDTHCHRVPNRLGWISTKTPEQSEAALKKIIPRRYWMDFNDIFVQFGQNICTPRRPKCNICPVSRYCKYYKTVYVKNLNES